MKQELKIINPLEYSGWNKLLQTNNESSFFHSSNWAAVLHEAYGYAPVYFTRVNENKLVDLIAVMELRSFLTGKRGVSLPFSDYCEPIVSKKGSWQGILKPLKEYGRNAGWKSIELRGGNETFSECPASGPPYIGHSLLLERDEEKVFSHFAGNTKRNIKKAKREGVTISIDNTLESLKEYYRLHCLTRKRHGLPVQPIRFFEKIYDHVLSKNLGFVVLASNINKINIAGAVYFHFGKKAIYKFGASDINYQHLRGNDLVMWEAIKWFSANGYQSLSFGRTEPDNAGLLQFKRGWIARERAITYYKYDIKKEAFVSEVSPLSRRHKMIFHNMPIPLLRMTGSILYRHIG
jgi:hypothetical protein